METSPSSLGTGTTETTRFVLPSVFSVGCCCVECSTRNSSVLNCAVAQDLRKDLNDGKSLGMPDGVLINGKGPYRYNTTLVPDGISYETLNVQPGDSLFSWFQISFFCGIFVFSEDSE